MALAFLRSNLAAADAKSVNEVAPKWSSNNDVVQNIWGKCLASELKCR